MNILTAPFSERYEYLKQNITTIDPAYFIISSPKDNNEYIINLVLYCYPKRPSRKVVQVVYNTCLNQKLNLINCMNDFDFTFHYLIKNFNLFDMFKNDLSQITNLKNKIFLVSVSELYEQSFKNKLLIKIINYEMNDENLFDIIRNMYCFYFNISPNYIYDVLKKLQKIDDNKLKSMCLYLDVSNFESNNFMCVFDETIFFDLYEMFEIKFDEKIIQFLHSKGKKIPYKYLSYIKIIEPVHVEEKICYQTIIKKDYLNINLKQKDILDFLNDTTKLIFEEMNKNKICNHDFKPPIVNITPNVEKLKNLNFLNYIKKNNLQMNLYFVVDKNLSDILNVHQSCMIEVSKVLDYLK